MSNKPSTARLSLFLCSLLLTIGVGLADPTLAQPVESRTLSLNMYLDWARVSSPVISPDGRQVIYGRGHVDKLKDQWASGLWIMAADGSRNRFLVDGSSPVWAPDGTRVAYLATGENGGTQIFVRWMDAEGAITQVTRVSHSPGSLRWSPDGRHIAFTMLVEDSTDENPLAGVRLPDRPAGATWTEDPEVVTRAAWQRDGIGIRDRGHDQIFVVRADGGTPRQLTEGKWHHQGPEWTPDGRQILFNANREEDHELQSQHSEIYTIEVATGQLQQLTDRRGPDRDAVASPDGRLIAYTGDDWTYDAYKNLHIYVMNRDGSGIRQISGDFDRRMAGGMVWAQDGSGVYFSADSEGSRNLYFASVEGGVRQVTDGVHMLTTTSFSDNGRAVGIFTSPQQPDDVVTFALDRPGEMERITRVNDDLLEGVTLGDVEEIWYESFDGWDVQGWVIKPPDFDPSRQYPLMLVIHGGPHAMYNVGFNFGWQEHAANGYVVLYTNPRGSVGYGSAFGNGIMDAYPGDDYFDLMAGVDAVIAGGYIDERNLFVYGCSGGGVLTAWVIGRTDRFAAASSNCPVTNWISWVGTADIAANRPDRRTALSFTEHFWDEPTQYLDRSPLMLVGNVTTPTMLITGEWDIRTPMGQTEEYYQALKTLGVPTAMVRMKKSWHGISSIPSNFLRVQLYLREWFEKWGEDATAATDGQGH